MKPNEDTYNVSELIKYRLKRADEMMVIASTMLENNWLSSAINRLYYGCFYANLALFLKYGITAKTHEGVLSMIGLQFVKTGQIDIELGRHYRRLFNARITCDYDDFVEFSSEQVKKFLSDSIIYIDTIRKLITEH